jgi:hypothetical protein
MKQLNLSYRENMDQTLLEEVGFICYKDPLSAVILRVNIKDKLVGVISFLTKILYALLTYTQVAFNSSFSI